jgi:hypothetical protein
MTGGEGSRGRRQRWRVTGEKEEEPGDGRKNRLFNTI